MANEFSHVRVVVDDVNTKLFYDPSKTCSIAMMEIMRHKSLQILPLISWKFAIYTQFSQEPFCTCSSVEFLAILSLTLSLVDIAKSMSQPKCIMLTTIMIKKYDERYSPLHSSSFAPFFIHYSCDLLHTHTHRMMKMWHFNIIIIF